MRLWFGSSRIDFYSEQGLGKAVFGLQKSVGYLNTRKAACTSKSKVQAA